MSFILGGLSTLTAAAVAALFHRLILAAVLVGVAVLIAVVLLIIGLRVGFTGYHRLASTYLPTRPMTRPKLQ